jgi:sialidase-1
LRNFPPLLAPFILFIAAVLPLAVSQSEVRAAAPASPQRVDVFTAGEGGYLMYRIPGIVVTAKGTLLAYCEARRVKSDWGDIDLQYRRSTDGGKTWSAPAPLAQRPPDAKRNPAAVAQNRGAEGKITLNNPVMIPDRSGAVHLLYCVEYGRVFHARSDDDCKTFGPPTEITAAFEPLRKQYDWRVVATGPGHGIQLSTGRLLVPVWLSLGYAKNAHGPSRVTTVYSDDGGATWHAGEFVTPAGDPIIGDANETAVVELKDGRVMANMRTPSPKRLRAVATSPDGATRWSDVRFDPALPEPTCFASILRLPGSGGGILFSNPHNPTDRKRRNLTLKLSEDDGQTWPIAKVLEPDLAAYSDLAAGPDGSIYCFFERGIDGEQYARLTLTRFGIDWLRQPNP